MAFYVTDKDGNEQLIAGAGRVGPRGLPGPPGPKGDTGDDGNPIGTVISFLGLTAPEGYLVCDGATYSIADYPALSAFIAAQFGSANHFGGDGTDTFAVPDLRNLFLRGYHGTAEEQLSGDVGARQEGTEHSNVYIAASDVGDRTSGGLIAGVSPDSDSTVPRYQDRITTSNTKAFYIEPKQYTQFGVDIPAHYTARPVNMAVLYCIKAAKTVPSAPVIQVIGGNRNLLDNWYFTRPINQMGKAVWTLDTNAMNWVMCLDRYSFAMISGTGTFHLDSNGLFIPKNGLIMQKFEYDLRRDHVTASILATNGTLYSGTFLPSDVNQDITDGPITFKGVCDPNADVEHKNYIQFLCNENNGITAVAVKLELGSVQTLAHQSEYGAWVLNDPPPDYATELAKCQRFFFNTGETCKIRIAQRLVAEKKVFVTVPLPVSMRTVPTITSVGNGSLLYSIDGSSDSVFKSYGVEALSSSGVTIWIESDLITSNFDGFVLLKNVGFSADI